MITTHSDKCCDVPPGQSLALVLLTVFSVPVVHHLSFITLWFLLCGSQVSVLFGLVLCQQVLDRLSSSASTASSIDDYSGHNVWNPLLEVLFLEHVNGIVDFFLVDLNLAEIAFSCHFALDLLYCKEQIFVSA